MFELPDAKRVRRSELLLSAPPSPSLLTHQEQYGKELDIDLEFVDRKNDNEDDTASKQQQQHQPLPPNAPPHSAAVPSVGNGPDEAFEFRLFSTATPRPNPAAQTTNHPAIHLISIRSPTPLSSAGGDGAFVTPHRPQSYYFTNTNPADPALLQKTYADVAVSGAQVLERARRTRWPGTALPWRVIHLHTSSSKHLPTSTLAAPTTKTKTRRTRAGQKRRLAVRKKYAVTTAKAETEREKRTRRNREKKVKKKEREKLKKEQEKKGIE